MLSLYIYIHTTYTYIHLCKINIYIYTILHSSYIHIFGRPRRSRTRTVDERASNDDDSAVAERRTSARTEAEED